MLVCVAVGASKGAGVGVYMSECVSGCKCVGGVCGGGGLGVAVLLDMVWV